MSPHESHADSAFQEICQGFGQNIKIFDTHNHCLTLPEEHRGVKSTRLNHNTVPYAAPKRSQEVQLNLHRPLDFDQRNVSCCSCLRVGNLRRRCVSCRPRRTSFRRLQDECLGGMRTPSMQWFPSFSSTGRCRSARLAISTPVAVFERHALVHLVLS